MEEGNYLLNKSKQNECKKGKKLNFKRLELTFSSLEFPSLVEGMG